MSNMKGRKMNKGFPKELLVYVCDYDNGEPVYGVTENVNDLPEDIVPGIGVYTLNRVAAFKVTRELQ